MERTCDNFNQEENGYLPSIFASSVPLFLSTPSRPSVLMLSFLSKLVMIFSHIFSLVAFTGVALSCPIDTRSQVTTVDFRDVSNSDAAIGSLDSTGAVSNPTLNLSDVKIDATSKSSTSSSKMPSMAAVQQAATNFAKDANTVSASLNQLPGETSTTNIKSLATTAFNAESDEDAQRAVLAAAAGSAGSSSNNKIVQNTPTVLKGLKAIMQNPIIATVKSNIATIQNAR